MDRETGKPKGFGFCEFHSKEDAESAYRNLNNTMFKNRQIRIDFAEENISDRVGYKPRGKCRGAGCAAALAGYSSSQQQQEQQQQQWLAKRPVLLQGARLCCTTLQHAYESACRQPVHMPACLPVSQNPSLVLRAPGSSAAGEGDREPPRGGLPPRGPGYPPIGMAAAQQSAAQVSSLLGGTPASDRRIQDMLNDLLASKSRAELWEVMRMLKNFLGGDKEAAKQFFAERPGLTKAVFQTQVLLGECAAAWCVAQTRMAGAVRLCLLQQSAQGCRCGMVSPIFASGWLVLNSTAATVMVLVGVLAGWPMQLRARLEAHPTNVPAAWQAAARRAGVGAVPATYEGA